MYVETTNDALYQTQIPIDQSAHLQVGSSGTCPYPLMLETRLLLEIAHIVKDEHHPIPPDSGECPRRLLDSDGEHIYKHLRQVP